MSAHVKSSAGGLNISPWSLVVGSTNSRLELQKSGSVVQYWDPAEAIPAAYVFPSAGTPSFAIKWFAAGSGGIPANTLFNASSDTHSLTFVAGIGGTAGAKIVLVNRNTAASQWASALECANRAGLPQVDLTVSGGVVRNGGSNQTKRGSDVASASTLTFNSDQGNVYHVTGVATCNHITTTGWQDGSRITIITTGVATLANNTAAPPANTAPMLTFSGANITTAASKAYSFIYDSNLAAWVQD